jgi:hypothetical protein
MNKKYSNHYLQKAHRHSIFHETEIKQGDQCACFHCLKVFPTSAIVDWLEESEGKEKTATCPFCGIDAVIGSDSGYPSGDVEFVKAMNKYYFNV